MRKLLQSALCLCLGPMLVAQQDIQPVSTSAPPPASQIEPTKQYVTLPGDTNIELLPPGPTTFGGGKEGVVVQFVVNKDVVVGGVPVVHAGVPVVGVVDHVKRGLKFKHRAAEMEIRVTEMVSGNPVELHLRCFDPGDSSVSGYSGREHGLGLSSVDRAIIIAVGLGLLALSGGDR